MAKPAFPDSSYAASECTDKKSLQQSNLIHEPVTDQLITDLKTPLSGWELIRSYCQKLWMEPSGGDLILPDSVNEFHIFDDLSQPAVAL